MKRIVLTLALFTVVLGAVALGQQTYTKYDPQAIHTPTFFTTGQACLATEQFKVYEPRDTTRLGAWQERLENHEAGVVIYPFDVCAREQTAMGHRIIRLPANTPLFTKDGKVVADGRCGNEIFEIFLPPQPEPPAPPPPPVARIPEPQPEPPAPPPPPVVVETPQHTCPTCEMAIELNPKARVVRLTAKASEGYLSGIWSIGGQEIGRGASLLVSHDRLLKLAGKGESEIEFTSRDSAGHLVVCKGSVVLQKTKKGRFWLFKIPVINCLYAWTVDIKNWSLQGAIEKGACAALGVGTWYTLTHGGVTALVGSKPPVRVISPP